MTGLQITQREAARRAIAEELRKLEASGLRVRRLDFEVVPLLNASGTSKEVCRVELECESTTEPRQWS